MTNVIIIARLTHYYIATRKLRSGTATATSIVDFVLSKMALLLADNGNGLQKENTAAMELRTH